MAWLKSFISVLFAVNSVLAFSVKKIQIGSKTIAVEVAESAEEHARGLMFRENLGADQGMLFVFNDEEIRSFWMKNTLIDLSIGYFDKNKTLVDIQEMAKMQSIIQKKFPTYPSKSAAMFALEMNKNWFKKNKIKLGDRFHFVKTGPSSRQ